MKKKIGIIAICKQDDFESINKLQFSYVDMVEQSWAIAYIIPANTKHLEHFIEEMDGFIFPGADEDVCPELYGQENISSYDCIKENDQFLLDTFDTIFTSNKPVLGICKWHQIINIYFWWTLNQDIDDNGSHLNTQKYSEVVHDVVIQDGSFLSEVFTTWKLWVNSAHHQCVDTLWKDLQISATSTDGYIEAIQHNSKPIYGFQWHPERMSKHLPIFQKFIEKI